MKAYITHFDISNNLGVDLFEELSQTKNNSTYVDNWIFERQEEIVDYIGTYAYGGRRQAENYFDFESNLEQLKRAILRQVEYTLANRSTFNIGGLILGADIKEIKRESRLDAGIAPRTHQILLNAGFLYSGRRL